MDTKYYCGIDLHSKSMVLCILDRDGKIMLRKRVANKLDDFMDAIKPYKTSIKLGVESTFNWYWLIDLCREKKLEILLGHAVAMKHIYGGKNKNDNIDSKKIADLLRSNLLPEAYAYPKEKRAVRDLLRRRCKYLSMRSGLYAHGKTLFYQEGCIDISPTALKSKRKRDSLSDILDDEMSQLSYQSDITIVKELSDVINKIEGEILKRAQHELPKEYYILTSFPGIGKIIALTMIYEMDTIDRFKRRQDFTSYCRLARPDRESNGKRTGNGNSKIGNPFLKCVFMEILNNATRLSPEIKEYYDTLKKAFKPLKARAIMANKACTIVYYMLKKQKPFDVELFKKMTMQNG
jgi:transposase